MKIKSILLLVVSIILISTTVYAATVEITADNLNVRKEASTTSEAFDVVEKGDVLSVIEELDGWYKISTDNGEGYISSDYAKKLNDSASTTTVDTTTVGYTYDRTEIKIIPLFNAPTIGKVSGDYKVIEKVGNWSFIETTTLTGWILTKDETPAPTNEEETTTQEEETKTEEEDKTEEEKTEEQPEEQAEEKKEEETAVVEPESTIEEKTMYVTGDSVYVRKGPGTSYESITRLTYRTDVTVTGESSGWYKIRYTGSNGNVEGYMSSDYLSETKPAEKTSRSNVERKEAVQETAQESAPAVPSSFGEEVVAYAKNYIGKPYVYGGSGPNSFDCSGFTMYVYSHFGYSLPHGATAQSGYGVYVSKENLQPGDLVFFLDFETMDGIGHVGIYVGDGQFIHASSGSAHAITISNLNSGSYLSRYYTARRLN